MKVLSSIREFFWPLLEPPIKQKKKAYSEPEKVIERIKRLHQKNMVTLLGEAIKAYQAEDQRRSTIEGKAATMIGFNGVLVALIINSVSWLFRDELVGTIFGHVGTVIILITIIYFLRAMWYALLVLKKAAYETVTSEKLLQQDMSSDRAFKKALIALYIASTITNYKVINEKVDNMVMAYKYLRCGIVALGILSFWIIGSFYIHR